MNIDLPKTFSMTQKQQKLAYIDQDRLILKMAKDWEKVAYEITYQMKGKQKCAYCGKIIKPQELSLDHQYARALGGPTIPNNLVPACETCNNQKAQMNEKQYFQYRNLSEKDKTQFRKDLEGYYRFIKKWQTFDIPEEWIQIIPLCRIKLDYPYKNNRRGKKEIVCLEKYYQTNHHFPRPILLDKNKVLLDEYLIYQKAQKEKWKEIPVILLDNVEVNRGKF